ncbi:aldehyde dehydrogenase family protein [Thalassobacillus sp. CUG 92003]|uniref:aldehyde dehydrogenase family protein n=1 Tax=Thalassobacillus sp. CUG 92003 TaxID=2736641 RepID=UPI0015E7B23F|nr:aldehyde dehydrogenase family protein [Thalassobacillus sp. CUG 92003]
MAVAKRINLFIKNKNVETKEYTEVKDPGNFSEVVGLVAKGNVQHVDQAVQSAHKAFLLWRKVDLDQRISLLLKSADRIEEEASLLAELVSKENGMLLNTTKAEITMAVSGIRNIAEIAESSLQSKQFEDESSWVSVEKNPMGVIAGIVPWNAPMVLTMQKLAPAVVTGNTIVFKPSPFAPMGVTEALKKMAEFFPPGVINIVHGDGDVGAALTTHPHVRKISFTGGGKTARHVMRNAADYLKDIHFELGGNDPAIILDDANLDEIMPKIVNSVFKRSGQYCYAIKRIYVPDNLYDSFYEKMVALTNEFKIGHQLNENSTFGPMNNLQQYHNVKNLIERIKESKAMMVELGEQLEPDNWDNGYYLRPVIVRDVEPDQELVTCEQFGPVIPLIPYQTDEQVIGLANNTEYGLGSSIWSSDFDRSLQMARKIEAGMTFINGNGQTSLGYKNIPFGGIKQSGIGNENSEVVFDEFTDYHSINYHKSE